MTSYWWFSFVDPDAEEQEQFAGACIVVAGSFEKALGEMILRGCNPGPHTEVKAGQLPKEAEHEILSKFPINKLLSKKELNDKGEFSEYDRRAATHH